MLMHDILKFSSPCKYMAALPNNSSGTSSCSYVSGLTYN